MKRDYYWDQVSEIIGRILKSNIATDKSVLEIGFSGGHFLEWLNEKGYKDLHGIEIRKKQYLETEASFERKGLKEIDLILGDVMEHNQHYDAIYSTGLIQCLNESERQAFLAHVASLSPLAIYTVPLIKSERNTGSNMDVAVAGCVEYVTENIPYELSCFYKVVRVGMIDKNLTHLEDTFKYYICNN